ncbi:MAG: hypothetical protein Q6J44_03730, partial [Gloeomargarita sp. DG02_4_bins_56]
RTTLYQAVYHWRPVVFYQPAGKVQGRRERAWGGLYEPPKAKPSFPNRPALSQSWYGVKR